MRRLILAFTLALLAATSARCDTTTSRLGMSLMDVGRTGWGTVLNNNLNLIDSGVVLLGAGNTFTADQTFSTNVRLASYLYFKTSTGADGALMYNPYGLGIKGLAITTPDGVSIGGVSGNPYNGTVDLLVTGTHNGLNAGAFAVAGSSKDATGTYSGFIATGPIDQSVLWSLPKKDGYAGQPLVTDGATHLSFGSISSPTFTNQMTDVLTTLIPQGRLFTSSVTLTQIASNQIPGDVQNLYYNVYIASSGFQSAYTMNITTASDFTGGNWQFVANPQNQTATMTQNGASVSWGQTVGGIAFVSAGGVGQLGLDSTGNAYSLVKSTHFVEGGSPSPSSVGLRGGNNSGNFVYFRSPPSGLNADYTLTMPTANAAGFWKNDGAGATSFYDIFNTTSTYQAPQGFPIRTKAQIQAITPSALGLGYYCSDCATAVICVSSGTSSANQFFSSTSRATGCQ